MTLYDSIEIRPRAAGVRDARGNLTYTYPEGSRWTLHGVGVAPAFSNETDAKGRQNEVITGLEVYCEDYDVSVKSYDRAWYQNEEWQVVGRVGRWKDPFTNVEMGSMFRLQAVSDAG